MPRTYRVTFEDVSVSAAQDLVLVVGATGKLVRIIKAWVGEGSTTAPTDQQLKLRCRYLPATVTNGSGGGAGALAKLDQGDAAASITARINDTTKATTSGTAVVLDEAGVNVKAGYETYFTQRPTVPASTAFVFELLSTPSGTLKLSGGVEVEEMG
jgi:hypothetical protein